MGTPRTGVEGSGGGLILEGRRDDPGDAGDLRRVELAGQGGGEPPLDTRPLPGIGDRHGGNLVLGQPADPGIVSAAARSFSRSVGPISQSGLRRRLITRLASR